MIKAEENWLELSGWDDVSEKKLDRDAEGL